MKRDVLSELASGEVGLAEVEALYDSMMNSDAASLVQDLLGLSSAEWTAFAHGVGFEELARWRADGWPERCPLCGKKLPAPAEFGWFAQAKADGTHRIVHIACL